MQNPLQKAAQAVAAYFTRNNYRRTQAVLLVAILAGWYGHCH